MNEVIDNLSGFSFHHIGIACFSIEETAKFYEATGWSRVRDITLDPCQNVNVCFYAKPGFPLTELIECTDENSPVNGILSKSGVSPYHCCYGVDDIEEAIATLKKKLRFMPTGAPVPSTGMPGRKVCFLYNRNFGLIEIVENRKAEN